MSMGCLKPTGSSLPGDLGTKKKNQGVDCRLPVPPEKANSFYAPCAVISTSVLSHSLWGTHSIVNVMSDMLEVPSDTDREAHTWTGRSLSSIIWVNLCSQTNHCLYTARQEHCISCKIQLWCNLVKFQLLHSPSPERAPSNLWLWQLGRWQFSGELHTPHGWLRERLSWWSRTFPASLWWLGLPPDPWKKRRREREKRERGRNGGKRQGGR